MALIRAYNAGLADFQLTYQCRLARSLTLCFECFGAEKLEKE